MWDEGPIPEELAVFPGYLLARLGDSARRRFAKALAPAEFHPRMFGVMTMVAAQPGMTQHQLHQKTAVDPSSMVAVIDELEGRGLAERRPHPADRRARAIYLTGLGEETLAQVHELVATLQRELLAPLTEQEGSTLHALLLKLAGRNGMAAGPEGPAAG